MRLYLLRHGEASYQAPTDAERELTARGRLEAEHIVRQHLAPLSSPLSIVSSPYVRAQQTANIAARVLGLSAEACQAIALEPWPELRSESALERAIERLSDWYEQHSGRDLLCVSHQPLVGQLVDTLAGLSPGRHMMGTSALACLDGDDCLPACMELTFLHQP